MADQGGRDSSHFLAEVIEATPGGVALRRCFKCGVCGGSCPSGRDMDHTPSRLFAMIQAGLRDEVLRSNTPWFCVACYYCSVRCPQEVPITDLMYALKRLSVQQGLCEQVDGRDFVRSFVSTVERHGRSFELGLATRYYFTRRVLRLLRLAPTGLGMLRKGRVGFRPESIRDVKGLRAILRRARALSGAT